MTNVHCEYFYFQWGAVCFGLQEIKIQNGHSNSIEEIKKKRERLLKIITTIASPWLSGFV